MIKGEKMSAELRAKISAAKMGRGIGDKNPKWRGGRMMLGGYWYIYSPDHPNRTKAKYVCEHRLVMEKQLGRLLGKEELIHHINGIKTDNRLENLMLVDNFNHMHQHKEVFEKQKSDFKGKHFSRKSEFKAGHNKGVPLTEEHKRRIGEANRKNAKTNVGRSEQMGIALVG